MKPLLPTYERLEKYIRRIDESRQYTNFGPLDAEYQSRLSDLFGAPCITGSSATSLITATLMALDLPKGSFVAMPSYTFPATAAAVVSAGHIPYFMDVTRTGVLAFNADIKNISACVVVAPFGASVGVEQDLERLTGVPTIIDAAAGFDAFSTVCKPGKIPVIISTHATKAFGTGEGGFVTCSESPLMERIRRITNFGLTPDRRIEYTGLNAKFSEYHAVVGLASLDEWPEKRSNLLAAVEPYGLDYAITQVPVKKADYPSAVMRGYGCHIHDAYKDCPRTALPVTEHLIETIGTVRV